ncbi:(S)-sulfolactate dehydrogenase [Streptomyces sp. YIM 130001]|uniref:hydroxyacid dehydrogenase n=1 Tax=Streptomyces sp. YIM 130001 TaxID=2259644 RepID=UPI000E656E1F|nr:hydroxyacid dehydrogenase [Streptomyces sp. YIM 130001]RII13900.1 (S)-sulfolactate dehydrogenase [Streptomyces sp. YIM 130001]
MRDTIPTGPPDKAIRDAWTVASVVGPQWSRSVLTDGAKSVIRRRAELVEHDLAAVELRPDVQVLITGWGTPRLTAEILDRFPALELVLHAAGSVQGLVSEALWGRGIRVSTAASANALAVADFTVAQIHLSLKNMWRLSLAARAARRPEPRVGVRGVDGATVGLIGLGHIGRLVAERLHERDVTVLAHDPYAAPEQAAALGIRSADLETVVRASDVLSLHAPLNDSTRHLVGARELHLMPPHATFLNTARGGIVDQDALVAFLGRRTDVFALLDVTEPEELAPGHPLFALPNVLVSPHIAGSLGSEEARLGNVAAAEFVRFADGEPLRHELTRDELARTA